MSWRSVAAAVALFAWAPAARAQDARALAELFRYDASAPLEVQVLKEETRGGVVVRDVTFNGGNGPRDRVHAFVVTPRGAGPFAAVLYAHWLGEKDSNRREFLAEALVMATQGVVSVLPDAMWSEEGWYGKRRYEDDFDSSRRQVVQLRRAMDLLLAQPGVDRKRVGFVGHDFGAMYGVLAGTVDQRARAYILMAATPRFADWMLYRKDKPRDLGAYVKRLGQLDPAAHVARLSPAPVFFQFAQSDKYVPREKALELLKAAGEPKLVRFYPVDHQMASRAGARDRYEWFLMQLSLR